uniref:Keratin-associated protein n=1 Tax=Jaculus jaculus TaxID=51337 RepID=A0A8C5P3N3_JACJA
MSYSCCSGNFSSRCYGGCFSYPSSCCGSFYPSNLVRSTHIYSPRTCHLGSSFRGGCQEIHLQPKRCQTPAVHSPCQRSRHHPTVSRSCSLCQTAYAGSGVYGPGSCRSLGYGSRNFCSSSCGSRGFTPLRCGIQGCPSTICGSRYCHPTYVASGNLQSSCYPTCGSAFWRQTC